MPLFNFKPIELKDPTKCLGCPHFDDVEEAFNWQICKAKPKPHNRVYYEGLDEDCRPYTMGQRDKRPEWCPLIPYD